MDADGSKFWFCYFNTTSANFTSINWVAIYFFINFYSNFIKYNFDISFCSLLEY